MIRLLLVRRVAVPWRCTASAAEGRRGAVSVLRIGSWTVWSAVCPRLGLGRARSSAFDDPFIRATRFSSWPSGTTTGREPFPPCLLRDPPLYPEALPCGPVH